MNWKQYNKYRFLWRLPTTIYQFTQSFFADKKLIFNIVTNAIFSISFT